MSVQAETGTIWRRFDASVDGRSITVLGLAGAQAEPGNGHVLYCVPARPLLAREKGGRPLFSLAAMLDRQPGPDDVALAPLVSSGFLGFTVTLELPDAALAQVSTASNARCLPLFARRAEFRLDMGTAGDPQMIVAQGTGARAAFSVALGRSDAVEVFTALSDQPGDAQMRCRLTYRTATRPTSFRFGGSWANIYDHLAARLGTGRTFDRAEFRSGFEDLVRTGTLMVSHPGGETLDPAAAFDAFLRVSSYIVERCTPDLPAASGTNEYALRARPNPLMTLDAAVGTTSDAEGSVELAASLSDILGGCLDGQDAREFMQFVGPNGGEIAPIAARTRQPGFRGPREEVALGKASLARLGADAVAMTAAARPNALTSVNAHVLMASGVAQPQPQPHPHLGENRWSLDDLAVPLPAGGGDERLRSLPVVEDGAAALWTDRIDGSKRWYAPAFAAADPAPDLDPDASPFLFEFSDSGHDMSGRIGLDGMVRIVLKRVMSEETRAAWEALGQPQAAPVETRGLSVGLSIPFRDQGGVTRTQLFPADIAVDGDRVTATVSLKDDWLRLCYGALAIEGFQTTAPQLRVAYGFEAYVPLSPERLNALFDRKQALTPVLLRAAAEAGTMRVGYLDAQDLSYRTGAGSLRFAPEPAGAVEDEAPLRRAPNPVMFAIRPNLAQSNLVAEIIRVRKYGVQTLGREQARDVLYPCRTLGAFYCQTGPDGRTAIGCRDAFTLGQTTYRQYERMLDDSLQHPAYTVWRSLQQPGRFLVVPAAYCIGRFSPADADRAYRPTIFLYSTIDAESPVNNRCVVLATLVPDLPGAVRHALERQLHDFAQTPTVMLVNEIEAQTGYEWLLAGAAADPVTAAAVRHPDGFQVSLAAGIGAVPQLQRMLQTNGITAAVVFTLPDGTAIRSALVMDLNRIVGPLPDGPVAVSLGAGRCTLSNRIERPVDVADLIVEREDGSIAAVQVDRRLAPDESLDVALPAEPRSVDPVVQPVPGDAATIPEIRSFIEDIHTNIAFVNLVNFGNHDLRALSVSARLKGVEGTRAASLSEAVPVAELEFVLPLTAYAADPVLEFQVTKTPGSGQAASTSWFEWPLASKGNVVSLTWDLIR